MSRRFDSALVIVECDGPRLTSTGREVLTVARTLARELTVVPLGGAPAGAGSSAISPQLTSELAAYGAHGVIAATFAEPMSDGSAPDTSLSSVASEVVVEATRQVNPDLVLGVSSDLGRETAAALAVHVGSGVVADATSIVITDQRVIEVGKTVYSGSWDTRGSIVRGVPIITVRPAAFDAAPASDAPDAPLKEILISVSLPEYVRAVRILERKRTGDGGQPLPEAERVVCVGRGMAANLDQARELAELLGATIGATRDVTDEGWLERSTQIGQTGVNISPDLYLGLGVSGAIHHTSGILSSRFITAVCDDPDAPIFELVDFGVVGDVNDVVPQLIDSLRAAGFPRATD